MTTQHEKEADCAGHIVDEECTVCGVTHNEACETCSHRGWHAEGCDGESVRAQRQGADVPGRDYRLILAVDVEANSLDEAYTIASAAMAATGLGWDQNYLHIKAAAAEEAQQKTRQTADPNPLPDDNPSRAWARRRAAIAAERLDTALAAQREANDCVREAAVEALEAHFSASLWG